MSQDQGFRVQMVACQETILREIADKRLHRRDVAQTYRLTMESDERDKDDWGVINKAIMERWSLSALEWIKEQAHSGRCFEPRKGSRHGTETN